MRGFESHSLRNSGVCTAPLFFFILQANPDIWKGDQYNVAFLKNNSDKSSSGNNENRKFQLPSYDRSKLPAHRFIKKLAENQVDRKYLVISEGLLLAALGVSIYFYYFA